MNAVGYNRPLYVLPFDHRHSYAGEVFGFKGEMTPDQVAAVAASKRLIYDGFKQAVAGGVPRDRAAILVDPEFGADVLRDAVAEGFLVAMPVEKSGQNLFDFQDGDDFGRRVEAVNPAFVKVLVRYNPEGDAEMNRRQLGRLKLASEFSHATGRKLMFEMLVPAEKAQLDAVGGDKRRYDLEMRPGLMARALPEIRAGGVEPDVWKVEGLDGHEDCERLVAAAREGGRDEVGCIILGRGEDEGHVFDWLRTAAGVPGFIGFAVGRSTFLEAVKRHRSGEWPRERAVDEVARHYRAWADAFDGARS